ncbi:MAG: GAF domain-containing protein [Acidobacteriota bacterium]
MSVEAHARWAPESRHDPRRALITDLLRMMQTERPLEAMLDRLARDLAAVTGSDRCGLILRLDRHDPDEEYIRPLASWSAPGVTPFEEVRVPCRNNTVLEEILRTGQPMVFDDCRSDPRFEALRALVRRHDIGSVLLYPLIIGGAARGIVSLHRCGRPRPFGPEVMEIVRESAGVASMAIDKRLLAEREQRRDRQIRLLSCVQREMMRLNGLEELLDLITRSLARTLDYRFVRVSLLEPDGRTLRVRSTYGAAGGEGAGRGHRPKDPDGPPCGLCAEAAAGGRPVVCNDLSKDVPYLERHPGIRSELAVPIPGPRGVQGVLSVHSDARGAFDPSDVDLFVTFAGQVGEGIRMARAYDLEVRRTRHLQLLHSVHTSVARLGDTMVLLREASDAIRQAAPGCSVRVGLVDRPHEELILHEPSGERDAAGPPRRIALAGFRGVAARAARTAEARLVPDVRKEPDCEPVAPGTLSAIAVPIRSKHEVVGVLVVESTQAGVFDGSDLSTFQAVADILGVALDNARLFERVEQEKEEWARTFDAITQMVSIHDQDYRLLRGNRMLIDRAGKQAYTLAGLTCAEVYSAVMGIPVSCPHEQAEREGRPVSRVLEAPGSGVFRLTAVPGFKAGNLWYSVHLCSDITEETHLREQLLQSEKMVAVGQLVSGVAHELNNPLASVMGYTQLVLSRPIEEKARKDLQRSFEEAQRAARIVQNLLTFARKHKPERRYLGLNGIVEKTLELRAYELGVSNIEVTTRFDPDLPKTMLDFHQLQQVILNIVTNAEQAMLAAHGRGRLTIGTRVRGDRIELRVEDDGPGMPPQTLSRIFDPFFTTKPVGQGTGLGLPICLGIVKEHGGTIRAESEVGRGTTFTVELPIVRSDGPAQETGALPGRPRAEGRSRSILVVDDEVTIQDLLVEILTQEGHRVDTAGSGRAALAKIEKGRYDLIISDMKMPGMNGDQFYERLRAVRPDLASRIIFTSGDTQSFEANDFLRRTGGLSLVKPFTIEALRTTLARFFDRL